jgi:hypothetical protein
MTQILQLILSQFLLNWPHTKLKTKYIFFSGQMVYSVRMQCGRVLAREAWVNADIVSSVPESGTAAAHGFSKEVCRSFFQ